MQKVILHTAPHNGGPFNCLPAHAWELPPERVLCNDIVLPGENHPHRVGLWVVWNEFGALGAVWAGDEQDALDELVDAGLGEALLVDEETVAKATPEERDEWACLGNAGEPADLTYANLVRVCFDKARDFDVLMAFAEARGDGRTTLGR